VPYEDQYPWPLAPDGNGPTLELHNPLSDNSLGQNWLAESIHGTPGEENSIVDLTEIIPESFALFQNYPNPFNNSTVIEFIIQKPVEAKLEIFDFSSKLVFYSKQNYTTPGLYKIRWNAESSTGKKLPQGLYIFKLSTENFSESKKAMLIR